MQTVPRLCKKVVGTPMAEVVYVRRDLRDGALEAQRGRMPALSLLSPESRAAWPVSLLSFRPIGLRIRASH